MCIHMYTKEQFKVEVIGILKERSSFVDQKCTSCKCAKKFRQGPPPFIRTRSKRMHFFQETNRPLHLKIGESTSELECGLNEQPAGHGKVSALQDDDAFNSYNI